MGSASACTERTVTSRSCPSRASPTGRRAARGRSARRRWRPGRKRGRHRWPATVRERMGALIAEDPEEAPEEAPLEVLRCLREEGHRLGESTFYRLHRAEREGLSKELMVRFEASRTKGQRRSSQLPCGAF